MHTLADIFGEDRAQELEDVEWLTYAGENNMAVLHKDERIRRRTAELAAIREHSIRAFVLTNGNLRFAEQARRFDANRHRIVARCQSPGPFIYGVYEDRIEQIWPK